MAHLTLYKVLHNLTDVLCLTLSKGEVNVALGKPTIASSMSTTYSPEKAVDGGRATNMFAGSCFHSTAIPSWWSVDLQAVYHITQVIIVNRASDNCNCRKYY